MNPTESLPILSVGVILVVTLLSGPFGVVDLTTGGPACSEDVFPGTGNASVEVVDAPETATLTKSRFGAEVYRLELPDASLNVSDVTGRPTVSYRLRLPALRTAVGATKILSGCTTGGITVAMDRTTFEPDRIDADSYEGRLFVVYRGSENGTKVEQELLDRNVTVEVHQ